MLFDIKNMFYWFETSEIISIIFIFSFFIIGAYWSIKHWLKMRKNQKLKTENNWALVKTKIERIRKIYHSWEDSWDKWYYTYALISSDKDWNKFQSSEIYGAEYAWRTPEEMIVSYNWKEYDLTQKDKVIPELRAVLSEYEKEQSEKWWILKHFKLKSARKAINKYIEIADEWLITPYIIKDNHKVSVWDDIDVYVDREEYKANDDSSNADHPYYDELITPPSYYFDLDFLKEWNKFKLNWWKILILINLILLILVAWICFFPEYFIK